MCVHVCSGAAAASTAMLIRGQRCRGLAQCSFLVIICILSVSSAYGNQVSILPLILSGQHRSLTSLCPAACQWQCPYCESMVLQYKGFRHG